MGLSRSLELDGTVLLRKVKESDLEKNVRGGKKQAGEVGRVNKAYEHVARLEQEVEGVEGLEVVHEGETQENVGIKGRCQ